MDSNFSVKITADISELQARMKSVEATVEKFKASMDKAAGATKNMEQNANRGRMVAFAFGQVIRDAGFFANSFSLGILAISNNIPILIDQLALSVKALQPFAGALSLIGSLLTAGLTIWAYSTQAVKQNKQSIDEWRRSLQDATEVQLKGAQAANEEITKLDFLYKAATNAANSTKTRIEAAKQLQDLYPTIFGNMSQEAIMLGNVSGRYENLRTSILAAAQAQAALNKIVENTSRIQDNNIRILEAQNLKRQKQTELVLEEAKAKELSNKADKTASSMTGGGGQADFFGKVRSLKAEILKLTKEISDAEGDTKILNTRNGILESFTQEKGVVDALVQSYSGYNKETDKAVKNREKISEKLYGRMATESLPGLRTPITGPKVKPTTLNAGDVVTGFSEAYAAALNMLPPLEDVYASIAATVTDGIAEVTAALGDGIGKMIAGEMGLADFGKNILGSMGRFLSQLGKQMVAFGVSALLFAKVYAALATGNFAAVLAAAPGLIAAGLALTIAGGIISGLAGKGGNAASFGGGGMNGGGFSSSFTTPMSNAVSSSMYGRYNGTLETRVSGNDLVILMNRADRNRRGNY
jgi:hypothetical protein